MPVGLLAYGLAVGLLTLSWHAPGRDALFSLNIPGYLLGEATYTWSIRLIGDPASPQAHYTVPWLLRTPQVVVPASVLFWGFVGALMWAAGRAIGATGRATELLLSLLVVVNIAIAGLALMPGGGLVRLLWAAAGLAGFVGVVMDGDGRSTRWGYATWASAAFLMVLGLWQHLGGVLYTLPALLPLTVAALLADRRRGRAGPATRALAGVVLVADLLVLGFVILVALPWPA